MITRDSDTGGRILTDAEVSKKAHETITDLAGRLLATPEFMKHLGITFFGRSFDQGGRSLINDGVSFPLGTCDYFVEWRAEPFRFSPLDVRNYTVTMELNLLKFTHSIDSDPSTSSLFLSTVFVEDQNGNPVEFQYGGIQLADRTHGTDTNPDTAFDKIPQVFPDFYKPIKL